MSKNEFKFSCVPYSSRAELLANPLAAVLLLPVFSSDSKGAAGKLSKGLTKQAELSGFKGDCGQTLCCTRSDTTIIYFGLGNREKFDIQAWRKALTGCFKKARTYKTEKVTLLLPTGIAGKCVSFASKSLFEIGKETAEIVSMVLYEPNHYKTEAGGFKQETVIREVNVTGCNSAGGSFFVDQHFELSDGLLAGAAVGLAVNQARDTANEPPNICTPFYLDLLANKLPDEITVTVYERDECLRLGMNAFLAVAKGSDEPPKFITMDYEPENCPADGPVIGLVGKSVTFDSGGLDLKPAEGMRDMKYDMCGGADIIAAMRAIAMLKLPIRVKAFCAATENGTGGSAYHPGDVYVGLDGKSYEIDNTDAEGRLTLVDAIAFARIHGGVTHIIDYATLTGAIVVALGDITAGVFSNNQDFADMYLKSAQSVGEAAHQMPISDDYKELNKSKIADMKNTGGRYGGAITAALFVLSAAGDLPAIHVDIAGVGFRPRALAHDPEGGTGWGVRTLVALVAAMAGKN